MIKALKRIIMIVAGAAISAASGTIFAQAPHSEAPHSEAPHRADSLARALATYWGSAVVLKDYTPEQHARFIEGLKAILADSPSLGEAFEKGVAFGRSLTVGIDQMAQIGLTADRDLFNKALVDVVSGKSVGFTPASAEAYIGSLVGPDGSTDFSKFTLEGEAEYLAKAAAEDGAVTTPSGLVFQVLTEGEGDFPTEADRVELDYTGRLSDGTIIDSTETPVNFDLINLVKGFSEGLQMMRPGGTYRIVIPASIGYGEKGIAGAIPPGATLDFTVTLLGVDRGAAK